MLGSSRVLPDSSPSSPTHARRTRRAMADPDDPARVRCREHGARRGVDVARAGIGRMGAARLQLVVAHHFTRPKPERARTLRPGPDSCAAARRGPPAHRRSRDPSRPRGHLQRDGARRRCGDLRQSYQRITRLLLAGLRALGVEASVAGRATRATGPGMTPCFDEPAEGELISGGRKLAGSAQWRVGRSPAPARLDPRRGRSEHPGGADPRSPAARSAAGHPRRGARTAPQRGGRGGCPRRLGAGARGPARHRPVGRRESPCPNIRACRPILG